MSADITFSFDDVPLRGRPGESLAAALVAAGVRDFRTARGGGARGIFCGMGVCQDCLVEVDGKPNQRACMTKLDAPLSVRRETFGRALPRISASEPPRLIDAVPEEPVDLLVIGAGPAGLSAAIAARRAGARVVVVDERPVPGGQYFKQVIAGETVAAPDRQHAEGRRLIDTARNVGVEIRSGVEIWGAFGAHELVGTQAGTVMRFNPERLIVATGAYERGVPVPGWTLPGVMTTGAAQTLWRSYRRVPGKRVLVAGNGPLNLQVASELAAGGMTIAAVVELAPVAAVPALRELLRMAMASPGLVLDGLAYRAKLARVPVIYGSAVTGIERTGDGLRARVAEYPAGDLSAGRVFDVDTVCLGYGFQPSSEILRALGCAHRYDAERRQFTAVVDADGRTSVEHVFCVGDCGGLGGARAALAAGTIAGFAAAGRTAATAEPAPVAAARRRLAAHRRFQAALWRLYAAPPLTLELATPETLVCRCEEVTAGAIEAALADGRPSIGDLKRATRAGMGPCQGRYCGPLLSELLARTQGRGLDEEVRFAPRMPVKPVAIADIARTHAP